MSEGNGHDNGSGLHNTDDIETPVVSLEIPVKLKEHEIVVYSMGTFAAQLRQSSDRIEALRRGIAMSDEVFSGNGHTLLAAECDQIGAAAYRTRDILDPHYRPAVKDIP